MTLQEWIKNHGGQREFARKYNFPAASVGAWYRLERFPRPHTQQKIQQHCQEVIDFKLLMKQYLDYQYSKKISVETNGLKEKNGVSELGKLIEKAGLHYKQSEMQARIIFASWAGKMITSSELTGVLKKVNKDMRSHVDLFDIDILLSGSREKTEPKTLILV